MSGGDPLRALVAECRVLSAVVGGLRPAEFGRATNCPPWTVQELVVHIGDSIAVGRRLPAAPAGVGPREAADYYRRPERDTPAYRQANVERARQRTRAVLAATAVAPWLAETIRTTVAVLSAEDLDRVVLVEGVGPMRLAGWVSTRVMSVAAHGLDLALSLGRRAWTTAAALEVLSPVLVSLLGVPVPAQLGWDPATLLQAGTGRRALTSNERDRLGPLAGRFPLLS